MCCWPRSSKALRWARRSTTLNVFANRRVDRLKVLVYDGRGMWLCTRRLQSGSFSWPREAGSGALSLTHEQFEWLVAGLAWQRMGAPWAVSITAV